eukprot:9234416-Pyramimonas_sp.AAC.1
MPISRTKKLTRIRPLAPEIRMISLADRQTGMLSRIIFLNLTKIRTSESIRRPDWFRPSPGKYGHP